MIARFAYNTTHFISDLVAGVRDALAGVKLSGVDATNSKIEAVGDGDDVSLEIARKGDGNIIMSLPTSDPSVAGALWANAGVVTVSAG